MCDLGHPFDHLASFFCLYPCILGCWHKARVISRNWQLPAKCEVVLSNPGLLILCTNCFFLLRPKISQGGSVSQSREGHHVCSCRQSLKAATDHSPPALCPGGKPSAFLAFRIFSICQSMG